MKNCCGKPRQSRFCPDCGLGLDCDPAESLLKFLRTHSKAAEDQCRKLEQRIEDGDFNKYVTLERMQSKLKRSQTILAKWNSWIEIVESKASVKK